MFAFLIAIHVIACALLILLVMVQQGKGGGLIDSLSSAESIFGTKTNTFLVKSTSVLAVVFFFTCLGLAFLSIQHNKSILTNYKHPKTTTQQTPQKPTQTTAQTPAASQPATTQPTTAQPTQAPATQPTTTQNPTTAPATQDAAAQVEKK